MSASITSGQEKQYKRFVEDAASRAADIALKRVAMGADGAQKLFARGDEFQSAIVDVIIAKTCELSLSNQFAGEKVASNWGYPAEYKGPKPIREQMDILAQAFGLSLGGTVAFVEQELPKLTLPDGAEGWFAIPRFERIASSYSVAVERVLAEVAKSRKFRNYREGQLGAGYLRQHDRTVAMWARITETQTGDIVIVPAQFGFRHRGKSVRRAREVFKANEFGLGAFGVGCMALTHSERFVRWEQLHVDCAGDEYALDADGRFRSAPFFRWRDGELKFHTFWFGLANECYGTASAFIPQ